MTISRLGAMVPKQHHNKEAVDEEGGPPKPTTSCTCHDTSDSFLLKEALY